MVWTLLCRCYYLGLLFDKPRLEGLIQEALGITVFSPESTVQNKRVHVCNDGAGLYLIGISRANSFPFVHFLTCGKAGWEHMYTWPGLLHREAFPFHAGG